MALKVKAVDRTLTSVLDTRVRKIANKFVFSLTYSYLCIR